MQNSDISGKYCMKVCPYLCLYIAFIFSLLQEGKIRSYEIGTTLRERYGEFLGPDFNIKLIEGRSSDFNRTKNTLQLVFAGLFPLTTEEEFVPGLKWQPIPYNYVDRSRDKVTSIFYTF